MLRDLLNDLRCRYPLRRAGKRIAHCIRAANGASDELNRRVDVENRLGRAALGHRPPPGAAECGELARKLGVPSEHRQ